MNFNEEIKMFPSQIQKVIYCEARERTPLETSLSSIKDDLRKSCKEYYAFYSELLNDMYENPLAYYWPVGEYEELVGNKTINAMKQLEPKKALSVVSHTANCVMRYTLLLCLLGYYGELKNNTLIIPEEAWKEIKKNTNVTASPISIENRLTALSRVGLTVNGNVVESINHPLMLLAMKKLSERTKGKSSGFDFYQFQKVDFRNIDGYKPTYVEYFNPLTEDRKRMAYELHDYAKEMKCKVQISTFFKTDYKYKGSQVMCIESSNNALRIRIMETYSYNDFSLIEDKVKNESKDFEKYFLKHIWRCRACSTTHLGVFVNILGKRNRVCGGGMIGMEWINPTNSDISYIKKFIDFRCSIINELTKVK